MQVEVKKVMIGGSPPSWCKGYEWVSSTDRWGKRCALLRVTKGLFKDEIVSYLIQDIRPID